MAVHSQLLCLPHELISEIVCHVAVPCSSLLPSFLTPAKSHWDAYSLYKLAPTSCRDLQSLALTNTHLVSFCRARLFRSLRIYPGMSPDRVIALVDLFLRSPELVQHMKALWWTVGVEEYKANTDHQWFKYASEEREVRKAKDRLELVEALTQPDGLGRGGLRKVWITGCESQRRFDISQRKGSPSGLPSSSPPFATSELVDEKCRVMEALTSVLGSPSLGSVSMANIAFPSEAFKGCSGLEELRLGDDVTVVESGVIPAGNIEGVDAMRDAKRPSRLRVLDLPAGSSLGTSANATSLFDRGWEGQVEEHEGQIHPILDLSVLEFLTCQYPSPAFSSVTRNLGSDNELKEVSLQVNNVDAFAKGAIDEAAQRLARDKPFDHLYITCNLPSTTPNTLVNSDQSNSQPTQSTPLPPPRTLSDQISDLITFLVEAPTIPARTVDLRFSVAVEQGLEILSGPLALDLLPHARRMGSCFADHTIVGGCQSVNIHFSLRPGCSSGYGGYSDFRGNESSGNGGILNLKSRLAERHAEAITILNGAGVKLEVAYSLVA